MDEKNVNSVGDEKKPGDDNELTRQREYTDGLARDLERGSRVSPEDHQYNVDLIAANRADRAKSDEPLSVEEAGELIGQLRLSDSAKVPDTAIRHRPERRRSAVKWSIIAVIFLGIFAVAIWAIWSANTARQSVSVPTASASISLSEESNKACQPFTDAELTCAVKLENSDTVARGLLVSQSTAAGEKINKGDQVTLTYSKGSANTVVPKLTGLSLDEAKKALSEAGLTVDRIQVVKGNKVPENGIVSVSPASGKKLKSGTGVSLSVSNGKIDLPNWVGKNKATVEADAKKLGVPVTFTEEESTLTAGEVISQSPDAGESDTAVTVNVTIAKPFAVKQVKVPDVIGNSQITAQTKLAQAGYRNIYTVSVKNADVTDTQVTQVVPGVGSTVGTDDNVVIIVSQPVK